MNVEQLEDGNAVMSEMRQNQEELEKWEKADKFSKSHFIHLSTSDDYSGITAYHFNVDFDAVKKLAVDKITSKIQELEKRLGDI